ncbi:MAG: hypothetical protein GWQ05_13115 [Verrucomicrobiaceae bacterium]|nr:hypothetical protein [Verrucomicrobiaceae bacterium]
MLSVSCLQAAPPVVDAIFPVGGQRGESVAVELIGKVSEEGLQFWASDPGITFGDGKLTLSEDCSLGAHWLRFYNVEGSALPQLFMVGTSQAAFEVEPNNTIAEANKVALMGVVESDEYQIILESSMLDGRLEKSGDVDFYAVNLKEGVTLTAEAYAYRLDSPIDPLIRLVDVEGEVLAWNHDRFDSLDPRLEYVVKSSGTYFLMIAGFAYPPQARSRFHGSADTVYRLFVHHPDFLDHRMDLPQVETRPGVTEGVISEIGEEDDHLMAFSKKSVYEITVNGSPRNSPFDAWLEIWDGKGKLLAKNDDAIGCNALLEWRPPADGTYVVRVRDLLRRGGDDYRYELTVREAPPRYEVSVSDHAWTAIVGETFELPVTVKRKHGHARPITVTLEGLPLSIDAQALTIPGNASEGLIWLNASAVSMKVIRLSATDQLTTSSVYYSFKGATTDEGALLRNRLEEILLIATEK